MPKKARRQVPKRARGRGKVAEETKTPATKDRTRAESTQPPAARFGSPPGIGGDAALFRLLRLRPDFADTCNACHRSARVGGERFWSGGRGLSQGVNMGLSPSGRTVSAWRR